MPSEDALELATVLWALKDELQVISAELQGIRAALEAQTWGEEEPGPDDEER